MESQEDDVNSLIAVLKHEKDSHVRAKAVEALGKIGDARVVEPLMQALKDEHWDVRRKAAWALGNIGDVRGVEPLIHALRDEYADVRRQAARSLAALTVLNEEIVKAMIHDCESKLELEEHEREDFQKIKRLYEQEHKRLRTERSG